MENKLSDFDKRPAMEKPLVEEAGEERLRDAKKKIKVLEEEIYKRIEKYIEQQVKPYADIACAEREDLKERLYKAYRTRLLEPFEEDVKVYKDFLEDMIDKCRRVERKREEAERAVKDIREFELEREFKGMLRDIQREKEKKP